MSSISTKIPTCNPGKFYGHCTVTYGIFSHSLIKLFIMNVLYDPPAKTGRQSTLCLVLRRRILTQNKQIYQISNNEV